MGQVKVPPRITLMDVANKAGFSRSTASLVFQESPLVAESTRRRVLDAAQELGYVYNRGAASLRMQRSHTVGLLIPGLSNPFFADLVEAVEEEFGPLRYTVLLGNTLDDPVRQDALIRTLLEHRIDGLLVVPAIGSTSKFLEPLERLGVPHLVLTRHVNGVQAPYVGSNDRLAGRLAAEHLFSHGVQEIAYFGGPADVYTRVDRLSGVSEATEKAGAKLNKHWSVHTPTSSTAGFEITQQLLQEHRPPDGIVCHSDAIAFGLMRALKDKGMDVGRDVRVVGFDDVEHAKNWSPSLTSVSVASKRMGVEATRMLVSLMSDSSDLSAPDAIFKPELQIRESCGH